MESRDGGDTWEKKTVYDNGMDFAQIQELAEPRLLPTSASIYIDENHKVHVAFSAQCGIKFAGELTLYVYKFPIGMIYWNDDQDAIDWQQIRGFFDGVYLTGWNWEEYPGYIPVPSVVGLDKHYLWSEGPEYNPEQFRNLGWAIYPKILAKDERVYVAYQSPLDYPFVSYMDGMYRGIFITVSEDYGETWDVQNNTSWISYGQDMVFADWSNYIYPTCIPGEVPVYHPNTIQIIHTGENAYPSMSYNYKGNLFMLQWMNDYFPFFPPVGYNYPINIITFTQDLRNIPAYKNIQEVYKGLWNGTEPGIVFPPEGCEKPSELTAIFNGEFTIISWSAPEYMPEPVVGYNVFRNGVKLNTSPIIETYYIDEEEFAIGGIYRYQVSAVYAGCESRLMYGVNIYIPQFCEKPVELIGIAEESDAIITWNAPENIDGVLTGYNIYRDEVKIAETLPSVREYLDKNLVNGTYIYKVSAKYVHCEESELTDGEVVVIYKLCEKPTELSGIDDKNTALITWSEPENIDGTLLGYNIYRNSVQIAETLPSIKEYLDEDLANGIYVYQVSATYEHCEESELTDGVTIHITVGIHGVETEVFQIFPNPTNGEVIFKGNGLNRIEIYDMQGRKLAEYAPITDHLQINVNNYENGIYFVKMYSKTNQVVVKRLVIVK
jgi:hypothetical protein